MIDQAVMALSGGMDSTGLLLNLLASKCRVVAMSFYYGQKHALELERAEANVKRLTAHGCDVEHRSVDLTTAMKGFKSALTDFNQPIPEGHYEQDNMVDTVVPNRNAIFASILFGNALSLSIETGEGVLLGLGVHSGDHAIYPDCRPDFYSKLKEVFTLGNWDGDKVVWYLPYLNSDKAGILQDALVSCDRLGVDFDEVFRDTNTSYNPGPSGLASGTSGADIERILAFHEIGRKDPVGYSEGWDKALENALRVKDEWDKKKRKQ